MKIIKKAEVVVKTPASFTLADLTAEQFAAIYCVLIQMAGSPRHSLREITEPIAMEMATLCEDGRGNFNRSSAVSNVQLNVTPLTPDAREAFNRMVIKISA